MVLTTLCLRSRVATLFRVTFGVAGYSVVTPFFTKHKGNKYFFGHRFPFSKEIVFDHNHRSELNVFHLTTT